MNSEVWSEVVYNFLNIYHESDETMLLIDALKPLYFARTYGFIMETKDLSCIEAEEKIIQQAELFKQQKCLFFDQKQKIYA